jgi:hypothetical protein
MVPWILPPSGKCGHYDYRLHVTGYEKNRDDFLSSTSIEEMKQIHVVGVFRRGARLRRRRRSDMTVTVHPRTPVGPTRNKRTVSGMGRFLAGSGAELWGIALRHPGCEMVESSGGICALNLVHVYICTSIRGVVLWKRTTPAPDFEYHYIGTWSSN